MTGTCPNCGAPLEFGGAQSLAAICSRCRSAVVRSGADLENVGKLPDLVATGSRLSLIARGAIGGKAFAIIGHLQLGHVNGDAIWDEWYVSFADGSWGWLAEAQGRLLFTQLRAAAGQLPAFDSLHAGQSLRLASAAVAVDEVNDARFVTAEGELPYRPRLNETYRFADCTDASGGFYTIDYGTSAGEPQLFAGRQLSYAEAGLADFHSPSGRHPEGHALSCPNCGANIGLKIVSSESVTCPSCRALLDITRQPAQLLAQLQGRSKPPLPPGAKGRIAEQELEVIGWMKRSVVVDGTAYWWDEYLLHGAAGYRWLTESAGHWLFMEAVPAGKVSSGLAEAGNAACEGRRYRHFQSAQAKYEEIQGEFYWRIETGARIQTDDYVAPPYVLSSEKSAGEINWSRGGYLTGHQVWTAFKQPGKPPHAVGVGAAQPNPYPKRTAHAWSVALVALGVVGLLSALLSTRRQTVLTLTVPLSDGGEAITLSPPFEIPGGPQGVEIAANASVQQAWIGLDVALINDESGESDAVGFELSHYEGKDSDGPWSEGNRSGSAVIGSVPSGRYVLRVEPEWQRETGGVLPSTAHVTVSKAAFAKDLLYLVIALIFFWPVLALVLQHRFEKRRWAESDHPSRGGL
jgi:hypothetical protein